MAQKRMNTVVTWTWTGSCFSDMSCAHVPVFRGKFFLPPVSLVRLESCLANLIPLARRSDCCLSRLRCRLLGLTVTATRSRFYPPCTLYSQMQKGKRKLGGQELDLKLKRENGQGARVK